MSDSIINLWQGTELSAAYGVTFNVRTTRERGGGGTDAVDVYPDRIDSLGSC